MVIIKNNSKVSLKSADYLLDEKLMTPKFRRKFKAEYAKVLLIQKEAEKKDKGHLPHVIPAKAGI